MVPNPALPRVRVHGGRWLRRPALRSAALLLVALAAALLGAGRGGGAWLAAGAGAAGLVAAVLAAIRLRTLGREVRQAGRARAEWERRHRRLYDNVAVGAFCADPQGRLTAANRGFCTLLGQRSEAELLAAGFADHAYVGPGTFEAVLLRARAQGAVENLEMRLRRTDGLTVTVLATIQAIWDEAGEVTAFEGTALDVTRERLAESQRRSMERRFRRLFDASAVGMLAGNLRRGTLEEANPALIELFGLRPSELPVPLARVIPPEQRALHRRLRAALEAEGAAGPLAAEYLAADGARVPVVLSAALVEPQYGEFVAILVSRAPELDAERRAAHWQALHEGLLEALPLPVASFDGERRLARGNRALCALLGVASAPCGAGLAELLGRGCERAVSEALARGVGGDSVRLAVELEVGAARRGLELILIPDCRDGATAAGFTAVLHDGPWPAEPRTASPAAAPVAGRPDGACRNDRRTA